MGSVSQSVEKIHIDGNQLLPVILEKRAKAEPNATWAKYPISPTSYSQGFRSVARREMMNAVNKVAWILEEKLGKSQTFETIAYIGPNDLRCTIVVLAGIKVGYKTFLPSPRNSKSAHVALLTRLNCNTLITTDPELPCISIIQEELSMRKLQIPSVDVLLAPGDTPTYPYNPSFEDAKNDPIFVLHTSGSTDKF